MNDKSPRQQLSSKSAKSLKQKRSEKRDQQAEPTFLAPTTRKPPASKGGASR